jgi:hypothetical protein
LATQLAAEGAIVRFTPVPVLVSIARVSVALAMDCSTLLSLVAMLLPLLLLLVAILFDGLLLNTMLLAKVLFDGLLLNVPLLDVLSVFGPLIPLLTLSEFCIPRTEAMRSPTPFVVLEVELEEGRVELEC